MTGKHIVAVVALSTTLVCPALAQTIYKTTPAGQSSKIDHYMGWNDDCSFKSLSIDVIAKPAHGAITSRIANGTITADAKVGTSGACAGKPTKVLEVYYKPEKGFHGSDTFTVNMSFGGSGSKAFYYSVNVP